ncbi:Polyhomeotic-like protein 1 [Camelus dromedarius]|uniref:Polyhomeotic-like protein 1 n=1 Tax=Camelus dromedarius TaxID=9838 RepID=A0A5N4C5S6_CAMDR|nr:Polyhomeotic-like protein 1 [Camelus dromedarius]
MAYGGRGRFLGLESEHRPWGPWTTTMETESEQNSNSANGSSSSGGSSRPQIAQMSLYERQAVQALQALQRQPNAAQYFHQFMLQQQLSNAQLHSLAAVQQATIAASRQASSPNTSTAQQQTTTTQASINLATTSAAQLISRSQSVSSPSASTLTQSVLLGNTTSPPLNQSQAQMYLRPQLGNLLQVNRTLGRNVPLASQLILMPNGAVAAVQQEAPSAQSPGVHTDADQTATVSQGSQTEAESAAAKKAEADGTGQQNVGMNLTRTAAPAPSQTLISSATYTQIQPHSLIQQQQQIHLQQKQVVIQQQIAIHHQQQFQHRQSQLLHTATHLQLAQQQQQPPPPPPQAAALTAPPPPPVPPAPQGTAHVVKGGATTSSPVVAQVPAAFYMQSVHLPGKPQTLAVKRKAESEEERDDVSTLSSMLPAKTSPVVESPKAMEEKSGLGEKADPVTSVTANTPSSDVVALAPAPAAPPPTLAMVSRQMGDSKPPQAIVKPQILTHIIEGFVIQEGAEPFPVGCSQLLKESEKPLHTGLTTGLNENQAGGPLGGDSPSAGDFGPKDGLYGSRNQRKVSGDALFSELDKKAALLKCEYCGKYAPAEQFRGSKRFCSMTCAKRYNVSCSHQFRLKRKKMKEFQEANYARVRRRGPRRSSSDIARAKIQGKRHRGQEDSSRGSDNSSYDEALSPTSPGPLSVRAGHGERDLGNPSTAPPTPELHGINPVFLSSNPSRWSVEEVYEFIASLQGCQEIAEEFRSQEIDGQALLLLKEEHLMSAMNIKLGPALKICAKINVLKET